VGVIVPRWEWRAFAEDFGDVDRRFDALAPERTDEIYVVTPAGDASVKVRDGLVDVSHLRLRRGLGDRRLGAAQLWLRRSAHHEEVGVAS
jgi:hypothetical protein